MKRFISLALGLLAISFLLAACTAAQPADPTGAGKLKVVATTTLVGDVVSQVAGDQVALVTLLPPGSDPHSFQPTPRM